MSKLVLAALAAAALALPAPAAHADHTISHCGTTGGVSYGPVTGDGWYQAAVYGYNVGAVLEPVSLRCYVRANGAEVASTTLNGGITVVTASGVLKYRSASSLDLCSEAWDSHVITTTCRPLLP